MGDGSFGTDLSRLWDVGKKTMPGIASQLDYARQDLAYTVQWAEPAFKRHPKFGGDHGPAYAGWCELRDDIAKMLGDTARNLYLTAEALVTAADSYAESDENAKALLQRHEADIRDQERAGHTRNHIRLDL
ncbi:MAG: hypothetical protein HOV77_19630 [Hamadaea sp.]|uniref:hypothetical protein n=1 Tax=Hamadaea sp. TaxID=2024425 RepID=UPI0017911901|nr:hypothetical protein [Hamadaea sp.]NUT21391.1 hypothetical protein [Hamadaea sp.]